MPKFLTFRTAGKRFSIDLDRSEKVVPLVALEAVPKADACVVGVMNLGGVSVPVIDLSIRLDLPDIVPYGLATSIVVCRRGEQRFGFIADRIFGVEQVSDGSLELADVLHSDTMPYLGVYQTTGGGQSLVLDLDRVLDLTCVIVATGEMESAGEGDPLR